MSVYELPDIDPDDIYTLDDLDERDRFAGVAELSGEKITDATTLTPRELEEFEQKVIELARVDPATFIQFAFEWPMQPCHCEWQDLLSNHSRLVLWAPVEHGKALPVDTEVPTAVGWKKLGDIKAGDVIFGRDGKPYAVQFAFDPRQDRRVYEFTLDDRGTVISDEDHLWTAWNIWDLEGGRAPRVVSTREIVDGPLKWRSYYRWKLPVTEAVQYPERKYPLHPYVLGCWLGDGTSSKPELTLHEDDYEIAERCHAFEETQGPQFKRYKSNKSRVLTVKIGIPGIGKRRANSFVQKLRGLTVWKNKHIPEEYLRGSIDQRLELMAGLLDTDGTVCGSRGLSQIEFCSSKKGFAEQFLELARSLGFKAVLIGPGTHDQYRVTFTARTPVFHLKRKLAKQKLDGDRTRTRHRSIVGIQELPQCTTRCLSVASPDGTFLVGRDYTVTHNSSGVVIARPIWELGANPNIRIAIISNTASQAIKCLSVIKSQIELNPRIGAVFPMLRREKRQGRMGVWHDDKITVQRDDLDNKDPSIQALGVLGAVMGSRIDLALLDDVLDFENTLHPTARERMLDWHDSSVESRLTANGREALVGTAWHREDLMHTIAQRPAWKAVRYDATTRDLWPELSSIGGKLCGWPKWRLEKKRKEIPALEFNRQFRNLPMSEESEIFNARAIEQCFDGSEWDPPVDPSWQTFVGVDLNVKRGETRDKTSFFIGRLDGGVKTVQRIIAANMNLEEILYWFMWIEARYKPVLFLVENNAAQDYIVQWFKPDTITRTFEARGEDPSAYLSKLPRVKGFTTGANKMDPKLGIWGMTIEFEQRRWRIPDHELTRAWKGEMLSFDPHAHTGDILMSSWLFHSAASKFRPARIRTRSISSSDG